MIFSPLTTQRIIFVLGLLNGATGLVLLFTCRCTPGARITAGLMKHTWYKRFYKYHCYLWWVFWPSVAIHATLAILFAGIPF